MSPAPADPRASDPARPRLPVLVAVLFLSYLCVAIPLPTVPVYVVQRLGLGNAWAGLAVGIAFASTIATRGLAGKLADRLGPKPVVSRGLLAYAAGALVCMGAGGFAGAPGVAFALLIAGRLLVGVGESLVGVGVITWGIGVAGPARSGHVLALVGAAIYGALAVGAPIGVAVFDRVGFVGVMASSAVLPVLGLLGTLSLEGIAPQAGAGRPAFSQALGAVWRHGAVVCLQGFGFASIGAFFVLYFVREGWAHAGFGVSAFGAGFVLVRALFGRLPDRLGGLRVAMGSLAIEALGQVLIALAHDPGIALAGAFMTGLGCSLVFPAMGREVVHLVAPSLRGTALGVYAAFQDLAYGITGPLAGLLADRGGYGSVFLAGAGAAAAGLALLFWMRRSAAGKACAPDT